MNIRFEAISKIILTVGNSACLTLLKHFCYFTVTNTSKFITSVNVTSPNKLFQVNLALYHRHTSQALLLFTKLKIFLTFPNLFSSHQ